MQPSNEDGQKTSEEKQKVENSMFNIFKKRTNENDSSIIAPEDIGAMAPGSYDVYARPLREPREDERVVDVPHQVVYLRPGHRPPGEGWYQ